MMYVNQMPFLHTTSEGIKLRTSTYMLSLTKRTLKVATRELKDICKGSGFKIRHVDANMQFECITDEFEEVEVDIVDLDDHAEEIERAIRAVK